MTKVEEEDKEGGSSIPKGIMMTTDIKKLLLKCEELVERFDYELAIKFCEKILNSDPRQIDALYMKATILIDLGETDAARKTLLEAVAVAPEEGHEKYVALAQLNEGQEALDFFKKALDLLLKANKNEEEEVWKGEVAAIYCAISELYMTDLCFVEDAEVKCEENVIEALKIQNDNFEALQTMANMRISQNRPEEAIQILKKSIEIWSIIPFEDSDYPSFEFRLTCSRLLVELSIFDLAQGILESLSQEDDEIVEVWYLLALSLLSLNCHSASNNALLNAERLGLRDNCSAELVDAIAELREALGAPESFQANADNDNENDTDIEDDDDTNNGTSSEGESMQVEGSHMEQ